MKIVGRNKSAQFRHESNGAPLPEQRKALFRPTREFPSAARVELADRRIVYRHAMICSIGRPKSISSRL
jgi:hypothetical protein